MTTLTGKVAIVTGASKGIGAGIAKLFAKSGASVVVNYSSSEDAASALVAEIKSSGGKAVAIHADFSKTADIQRLFEESKRAFGSLDILVNNAGVAVNGMLARFSDDSWKKTLSTNLDGAFHCTRAASMLVLKAKAAGRIINITSVVGEMGNGGQVAYAASKAGLIGLTMATAKELASRGVTVNAVSPGFIETDMTAEHLPEAQRVKLLEGIPLGRIGGAPEVADTVAFLAGPGAAYITGQVIRVNGGLLM
jgi:3-oxoacyl-[acyl-carrier protein] reductase